MILLSLLPVRADTVYPMLPCRVFVDGSYNIDCGAMWDGGAFISPRVIRAGRNEAVVMLRSKLVMVGV
jgi:hypothetical protein